MNEFSISGSSNFYSDWRIRRAVSLSSGIIHYSGQGIGCRRNSSWYLRVLWYYPGHYRKEEVHPKGFTSDGYPLRPFGVPKKRRGIEYQQKRTKYACFKICKKARQLLMFQCEYIKEQYKYGYTCRHCCPRKIKIRLFWDIRAWFSSSVDSIRNLGSLWFFLSKMFSRQRGPGISFQGRHHMSGGCGRLPIFCMYGGSPREKGTIRPATLLCLPGLIFGDGGGKRLSTLKGGNLEKRPLDPSKSWDRFWTRVRFNDNR